MLSALAALALAASSVPSPAQERESIPSAPLASAAEPIAGRVVDAGGAPLGNVLVRRCVNLIDHIAPFEFGANVFDLGRAPSSDEVRTAPDGSFRLPAPTEAVAFVLEVELADGGIAAQRIETRERSRDASVPFEIAAPRRRVVAGRVVDAATGAGVPLATIAVEHETFGPPPTSGDVLARGGALMTRVEGGDSVWEPPAKLAAWLREGLRLRRPAWRASVRAGADGSFAIPVLEASMVDEVALAVSADGYGARLHAVDLDALAPEGDAGTIAIARATPTRIRVLDADGRPVAGATVRGSAQETPEESFPVRLDAPLTTGADGAVEIALPSRGIRWVAARAPGGGDWTAVRREEGPAEVEIRLGKPASLRVRILDEEGRPLDGECALLAAGAVGPCEDLDAYLPYLAPAPIGPELARAVDGVARIDGVLLPQHLLAARAPRHAAFALPVDLDAATGRAAVAGNPSARPNEVEVRLRRLGTRRVRVVESGSNELPVPGAVVAWKTRNRYDGTLPTSGTLRTDAEGVAAFSTPRGMAANLEVEHPEFAAVAATFDADDAETTVRLSRGGSLAVRVLRAGGPIPRPLEVRLIARSEADEADLAQDARIAAPEGACRFEGLAPGAYEVDLLPAQPASYPVSWLDELERSRRPVLVAEGAEALVEIDLAEPADVPPDAARLRGTVAALGTRVPLEAWLDGPIGSPDRDRARWLELDEAGAFHFVPLPAGEYVLNVRFDVGRGYDDVAERRIALAPAERAIADLAVDLGGPLRGVVRDAATGEPIEGARVRLCAIGAPGDPDAWRFAESVETAEDGRIAWPAAPAGAYWLRILAEDRAPHYARVEVVAGRALDLGEIALARGVPVGGRVADAPEGAACLRFEFETTPADLPPRFFLTFDAAHAKLAEGTAAFATRELRPGRYTVHLEDEDGDLLPYREIALDLGPGGADGLELRFEPR